MNSSDRLLRDFQRLGQFLRLLATRLGHVWVARRRRRRVP